MINIKSVKQEDDDVATKITRVKKAGKKENDRRKQVSVLS